MIGYLTGKIISKKPTRILVDVNGIGYLVNISISTFEKIADINDPVSLYTYLHVREDALDLYGFYTQAEKDMFKLLIGISGIGPKLAQSILSGIQIDELKEALQTGNISRIVAVPGIGKKTAERLLVELRDKVDTITGIRETFSEEKTSLKNDAVAALTNLGYNRKTAENTIRKLIEINSSLPIEELIKKALAVLNS